MAFPVEPRRALLGLALSLLLCGTVARAQEETAPAGPDVKLLTAPQAVLEPAVDFLSREPVVDGRLDEDLQALPRRSFSFLYKPNPATPDTVGEYRLAYGTGFFYLFIDVQADQVIYRDRGYQNGDGFVLVLNAPRPDNETTDDLFLLGYHPTGDPRKPFAQMVWKRNDQSGPSRPSASAAASTCTPRTATLGFEALLRWDDVHPYHPWLSDGVGFNIFFSKAIGQTDVNVLAVNLNPSPGQDPFGAYSRLSFAPPALAEGTQSAAVLDRNHLQAGESLEMKIAALSSAAAKEQLRVTMLSGEGTRVGQQTLSFELEPGLSVREATVDTSDLVTGGYLLRWESRANTGAGKAGLTVLPPFDAAAIEKELSDASGRISQGSVETLRFHVAEIEKGLTRLKPHDTCPALRAMIERLNGQLRAAVSGRDVTAEARGFVRRAFRSNVDGSLQPYTIFVPERLEPTKRYPAMVFLHGSDSDDQSIKFAIRSHPVLFPSPMFVIAPYGRGESNAYTKDHAQEDIREAVSDALRHYPIDPSRLVLAGFSMGGYGVYRTLYEDPGRYAAAAVFSGHPDQGSEYAPEGKHPDFRHAEYLKPLRGVNMVVLHGGRDRNCPVELTVELVSIMKGAGIPVLFLLDEKAGHEPPRDPAIQAQYLRWLEAAIQEKPGRR